MSTPSVARFIDSAANALDDGNGDKLRQTLSQLSGVARILADGSGNIVDIIKNLQTFVTALRDSKQQIVLFQNRLATLTSVLDDSRSDLDAALTDLSVAVGEVQRFVAGTRDQASEQIQRLANVTQNLVDHRMDLENVLHVTPAEPSQRLQHLRPETGGAAGVFVLNNFSNPVQFFCGMIGAVENVTATETGKLCAQYLGPGLRLGELQLPAIPGQPVPDGDPAVAGPDLQRAAPGTRWEGPKPAPPDLPPAVSAYTGLPGDTPGADWPPPRTRGTASGSSAAAGGGDASTGDGCRSPDRCRWMRPICCFPRKGHRHDRADLSVASAARHRCMCRLTATGMRVPGPELAAPARRGGPRTGRTHLPRRDRECRDAGIEFAGDDRRCRGRQRRQDDGAGMARRRRGLGATRRGCPRQCGRQRRPDQPAGIACTWR